MKNWSTQFAKSVREISNIYIKENNQTFFIKYVAVSLEQYKRNVPPNDIFITFYWNLKFL